MADRVRVREISNEEGQRLLRIVRRSSGSVVTWRRAQMVLLSAQGMDVAQIAKVAFTSEDRVRAVLHNFNDDGFESLYPKYSGGRPPTFTLPQRREIKKNRVLELYDIADGKADPTPGDPTVVFCVDEFGPLNLQPHPGRQWAPVAAGPAASGSPRRRRRRATFTRPHGVRHLLAAYDLGRDRLYGHIKPRKGRIEFLAFCRYLRSLYPPEVRIAIVLDNFSPHLSTKKDTRVGDWAAANNVELAYVPFYASWLNRIEAQFTALRYFALDGTDHESHHAQARMIRRYIAWRNRHAHDKALRELVKRANVA